MPDVFLSYSREDQATARTFAAGFERAGFSVWWDQTLRSGEAYDKVTEKALAEAKAVVVLWSAKSVDSRWVRAEATQADRSHTLVPVMIEACKRPIMFELTHTADLSHWNGDVADKAWLALVNDVREFVGRGGHIAEVLPVSTPPKRINGLMIALAAALLVVAAIALWALTRDRGESSQVAGGSAHEATANPANSRSVVSLAVLPFVNLSSDPEQEYFSDGLSEEVLNQLAQVKDLRVTARTSSFSFKGKNEDLRVVGEKLGVGNIIEGSVRKSGKQLRITAQLINATDGSHLWSQTYDRELNDVFAIQEEIAMAVAQALSVTLDVGEMSRAKGGTTNLEAYDKYLRGLALDRQRGTQQDLVQAAQLYREAVALDPQFARAWTALHEELGASLIYVPGRAVEARKEMGEISGRLLALAPDSGQTQFILATQLMVEHKWSEAETAIRKGRAAGGDARADVTTADTIFLLNTGRLNEAAPRVEGRRLADPLSLNTSYAWQIMLYLADRQDESHAEYERSKPLAGNRLLVDSLAVWREMARKDASPAAVKSRFQVYLQHQSGPMALDREMGARLGDNQAMRAAIHKAFDDPTRQTSSDLLIVAMYADHVDDTDMALSALRRSYVELRGTNIGMLWQPFRNNLHADPRFKEILRDLGLADYFRASGNWGDFCKPVGKDDFECH